MVSNFVEYRLSKFDEAIADKEYSNDQAIAGLDSWRYQNKHRLTDADIQAIETAINKIKNAEETAMSNTEIKTEETAIATNEELQEIEQYKTEVLANRPIVLPWKHTDFKTAYIIEDYPYGRTLRCKKAVWLETATKGKQKGKMRSVYQTTNPKHKGNSWNSPHASQYTDLKFLYIDPKTGYLEEMGLSTYSPDEIAQWKALWYPLLNSEQQKAVDNLEKKSIALNAMWKNVKFTITESTPINVLDLIEDKEIESPIAEVETTKEIEQPTEVETEEQPTSEKQTEDPQVDLNKLLSDISNLSDGMIASCLSKSGYKCNDKNQIEKVREEFFDWTACNYKESDRWQDAWHKFAELFDFTEIIKSDIEWEIRFVCASEKYDSFDTHTLEILPYKEKNGKQFRKVAINPHNLNWQTSRYFSGNCRPHTADEFETLKGILIPIVDLETNTIVEVEPIAIPTTEAQETTIAPTETTENPDSENWEEIDNRWDHTPTIEVTEETEETVADLLADIGLGTDTLESAGIEVKSEVAIAPKETMPETVEPIAPTEEKTNLIQFPVKETETAIAPTEVEPAAIEAVAEVNPIAEIEPQTKTVTWLRVNTHAMFKALSNNSTVQRLYKAINESDPSLAMQLFFEETLEIPATPKPTEELPIAVAEVLATKPKPEIVTHTSVSGTTQEIAPKPQRQKPQTDTPKPPKPARQPKQAKTKTSDGGVTPAQKLEELKQLKSDVDAKGKKVVAEERGYSDTSTINANLIGYSVLEQSEEVKRWFLDGKITWSDVRETRKQINKKGLLGVIEDLRQKVQKAS